VGSLRYDKYRYDEQLAFPAFDGTLRYDGRSPRLGATVDVTDEVALFASASRTFKAPNIDDLDAVLPPFNDNVDLHPQQADHYEAGARARAAPWCQVEATGFLIRIDDEILFDPFTFANGNVDTRRVGAELGVNGRVGEPWKYGVTYSIVRAEFRQGAFTGYHLPITPEHRATTSLTYHVTSAWSVRLDGLLVSDQFRVNDFLNRFPADNYGVVDLHVRYERPSWDGFFTVQNLLNEEYSTFQSSTGVAVATGENPAPPTAWLAGITIRR
jgi:outer membrane receptor protein involved in Fe transport